MHRIRLICLILLSSACSLAQAEEIAPFTTDGCSDFPNGTPSQSSLWLNCCVAHDKAYWAGGTYAERLVADNELERCVAARGEPLIGGIMLVGVRIGGSPHWPTTFRWGYGWAGMRGYQPLSADERQQVSRRLAEYQAAQAARDSAANQLSVSSTAPSR